MAAVSSPTYTGVFAIIAFVYCLFINSCHFYLTKTSKPRHTIFGRRLTLWSHLSMVSVLLAPLFMIFSYFHPESSRSDDNKNDTCLCQLWFSLAVICFSTGLFLLKINYLVRLNMVLNPGKLDPFSICVKLYLVILVIESIIVNYIRYIVVDASCIVNEHSGVIQNGCVAHFEKWDGWMAVGLLTHDIIIFYLFCLYYIRSMKAQIKEKQDLMAKGDVHKFANNKIRRQKTSSSHNTGTGGTGSTQTYHLQLNTAARDVDMDSDQQQTPNLNNIAQIQSPASPDSSTQLPTLPANKVANKVTNKVANKLGNVPVGSEQSHSSSGSNTSVSNSSTYQKMRQKKQLGREIRKIYLIYNGLVRQFRITLMVILVVTVDMIIATLFQSYNLLFLFMIDTMICVTLNFLAFRDSQYMILHNFYYIYSVICDSCGVLVDVCCCLPERSLSVSERPTFTSEETNSSITFTSQSNTKSSRKGKNNYEMYGIVSTRDKFGEMASDREDSFVRYETNNVYATQQDKHVSNKTRKENIDMTNTMDNQSLTGSIR